MTETWSRRLRILLVASLAVNLFFIAVVAAWAVAGPGYLRGMMGFGHGPRMMGMPFPRQIRDVLNEPGQQILDSMLEARRDAFHANLDAMFEARAALAEAIAAKPFDRGKVEAAMAALRDREAVVACRRAEHDPGVGIAIGCRTARQAGRVAEAERPLARETRRLSAIAFSALRPPAA